ncbi:hypothetical protein F0814_004658 [Escherichia coli]|nr:hypothetical protein [Escherichia coli]
MKLTPVIAALRARCPYFENRVAGAAQFKNLPEVGKLKLPAAYVVPGDDSPGENKSQTDYWQELKEGFSVVVILSNGRDERGQFASYDVVDDVRQMLFKALLGWNPEACGNASIMLGYVSDAMKVVDSAVSDAARLLQGDISVLLPPPSSGKNFVEQVQKMWRTGKRLYGNASDLVTMIKTLSGVSLGSDLQPRGVWKTDSKTTATATQQRNMVASTLRTTAISEAAYAVTRLPAPTTSAVMQNAAVGQSTTPAQSSGWPAVTHPVLNNAPAVKNTVDLPTWEELTDIRDTLNTAIDKELSRTTSDALFLALRRVKADLNADINTRLEQSARIIQRTPDEVLPALVLAATWFDNAARDADIIRRNAITHPGFVPVIPLKVPVQ